MAELIPWLVGSALIFQALQLAVTLSNSSALLRLESFRSPMQLPTVSVLVPARDEERNIGACLRSLLAQDYPDFEVLALDDGSQDRTGAILSDLAREQQRLVIVEGEAPPAGWLGKNWACHQLAQRARGELLLFTDADTRHSPQTLRAAVSAAMQQKADLLTAIPQLMAVSWGERLILPLIPWSIFSLLPLALAHRLRLPALSATIGQFCLFRRSVYTAMGGHQAVSGHAAEDLALGRLTKRLAYRWRLVDAQGFVTTRMYPDRSEAWRGLSKNLYPAFGYRLPALLWAWGWLNFVAWLPIVAFLSMAMSGDSSVSTWSLAAGALALNLAVWGLALHRFRYPLALTLLHPVMLAGGFALALNSAWLTWSGRASWKGRRLLGPARSRGWAAPKANR